MRVKWSLLRSCGVTFVFCAMIRCAIADPPRVILPGCDLKQIASSPDIVTPIGLSFTADGHLLVVESHTHQRPSDYTGPASDRIIFVAEPMALPAVPFPKGNVFAEGYRHAMSVLAHPDGGIYVVTRSAIYLIPDRLPSRQKEILRLESTDDYPHNGLGGIAFDSEGWLIFGLGENHGKPLKMTGSDGAVIEEEGGHDGIYRMDANGEHLSKIADGMWNPFGVCVTPDGRIFAVDNDPDASPPCRLLHVVPGGDYGYLFKYGRAGTHPLQAWDGELPGTLPMVCGVGEAPTAIIAHQKWLWVTSWGDHRIERYELIPRGASYTAKREIVVQGDADFRPTGLAVGPDDALYFGDWVARDYPVHGKGRLWRLAVPFVYARDNTLEPASFPPPSQDESTALGPLGDPFGLAASKDPFAHLAGVVKFSKMKKLPATPWENPQLRLATLEARQLRGDGETEGSLRKALTDPAVEIRLYALRHIADKRLTALRENVAALLERPIENGRYYLAILATLDWLDHEPSMRAEKIADELLTKELANETRPPEVHALALMRMSPTDPFLTSERMQKYLASTSPQLRLAAVRVLSRMNLPERFAWLAQVVQNSAEQESIRAEALMALAPSAQEYQSLLKEMSRGGSPVLEREAQRVLRLTKLTPPPEETKPPAEDAAAWEALLSGQGDAAAGRRIFFSTVGARCADCHCYDGQGGRIGPDLTRLAKTTTPQRIIASILRPSEEIAPDYQPWVLQTADGRTLVGLKLSQGGDSGKESFVDSNQNKFTLKSEEIELRTPASTSIMPGGLEQLISIQDLQDLVTFLSNGSP